MLVLPRTGAGYPDDADGAIVYRLPAGVAPVTGTGGSPAVTLSRSRDGGLLHLRLDAEWPVFAANERRVPFAGGRFRLALQTPVARETGQWWPSATSGDVLVERSVSLTPVEAAIARHLGETGADLVDVEIELDVRGRSASYPWLVSVPRDTVQPRLAALIRANPASWSDVEAAFLGLTEETFTWYPLQSGALRPARDAALRAIAHHMAPLLMTVSAGRWSFHDNGPTRLDINLDVPVMQSERVGFRWSLSRFLAEQPDPKKHLVDLAAAGPFAASVISLTNDLPLAPDGIGSIAVEIRTGGPTGTLHHEFRPGEPSAARLAFVTETFDESTASWRARYAAMTANGPAVDTTELRPAGRAISIDRTTLGLCALRFVAEPSLFDSMSALEVGVGSRTLILTAHAPQAWAVGRKPPATVSLTVVALDGTRAPAGPAAIDHLGLTIDPSTLGVGAPATITIGPPADLASKAAYLAVQAEGFPWRTVDADGSITVLVRLAGAWLPPQVKYRTRHVPRSADGSTGPIAESPWRTASGNAVTVEL